MKNCVAFRFRALGLTGWQIILFFLASLGLLALAVAVLADIPWFADLFRGKAAKIAIGLPLSVAWVTYLAGALKRITIEVSADDRIRIARGKRLWFDGQASQVEKIIYRGPASMTLVVAGRKLTLTNIGLSRREREDNAAGYDKVIPFFCRRYGFRRGERYVRMGMYVYDYERP